MERKIIQNEFWDTFIGPLPFGIQSAIDFAMKQEAAESNLLNRFPHAAIYGFYPAHDFADDWD